LHRSEILSLPGKSAREVPRHPLLVCVSSPSKMLRDTIDTEGYKLGRWTIGIFHGEVYILACGSESSNPSTPSPS
jgi:hypothetical protein